MRWLKLALTLFAYLLVVLMVAVATFAFFADAEEFKAVLVQEVQQKTGYELIINGRMAWSLYPHMAIKVDRMMLRSPSHADYFVDARQVRLAADWLSWLQTNQRLQGRVSAARLRLMKMNIKNAQADLHWQDDVLTLNPIKADLYKGKLLGQAKGSQFFVIPHWQWDMQIKGVELNHLLRDVNGAGIKLNVSGLADVKMQGETQGKNRVELLNQLNGTGDFAVHGGVLEGVDINYYIKSAESMIRNDPDILASLSNEKRTPFSQASGSFVLHHGEAETNNLLLLSQVFSVKAKGSVEVLNRVLHFQMQVKPEQNDRIKWYVPLLVSGTLSNPEFRLDTMEIQQLLTGQQIEKVKQKALDQIKKHVPGKTGDVLKHLLGN